METLRWIKDGKKLNGIVVKRFQDFAEQVIEDPYWLENNGGRFGNDGWFGEDSDTLARLVQTKLGLTIDGIVGPNTWKAMFKALGKTDTGANVYTRDDVQVVDGRSIWVPQKYFTGERRPWVGHDRNVMRGVVIHQTGCWMPEDPNVWARVGAHCGITREGVIILMFPFDYFIWHAQGLSHNQLGIEIAGLFKGVEDSTNTWWPKNAKTHNLTEAQVKASNVLFDIIKEEFIRHGAVWSTVYSHRQASEMRMSDPGEEIWKRIGMPWIERLGATDGGDNFKTGSGYSIPKEWNPNYTNGFWAK